MSHRLLPCLVSLASTLGLLSGCGQSQSQNNDDQVTPCQCLSDEAGLEIKDGTYHHPSAEVLSHYGIETMRKRLDPDLIVLSLQVAGDDIKVRFARDKKIYDATFKASRDQKYQD